MFSRSTFTADLTAGAVVFLVALPLCLGVALTSGTPLVSGLVAGIVGGIVVGALSGSHTSVSGPSAALTAVIVAQLAALGSFESFLLALVVAGLIQIGLGLLRAGFLAEYVPSSVIKGLLAAIGVILVLKQIPHVVGLDDDPQGDMAFEQPDGDNTFTELGDSLFQFHTGAALVGLSSVAVLLLWDRVPRLKKSIVPAPLVVVLWGVGLRLVLDRVGGTWSIGANHLVQVPIAENFSAPVGLLDSPDFSQWLNPRVYTAGLMVALVASLESLLNLEAVDKIDPQRRNSPANRELLAQGAGNIVAGLLGGIPISSVIVRSSVNVNAGGQTKLAAVVHGVLLLVSVALLPTWLNMIPLACLAAILLVTGTKLANPALVKQMFFEGRYQFFPFAATVAAIVLTDLLIGVLIGLAVSIGFILNSNFRRPIRRFVEKHLGENVTHLELANQVSFLNRAALTKALDSVPRGGQLLLDAQTTDYIDPDVLDLIRDYVQKTAPARGIEVSLLGFLPTYDLEDRIQYLDHATRELQSSLTPARVLQILKDGNERFRAGRRLTRDLSRQVHVTAQRQHPLAVVLNCMDSRSPAELIFDAGIGDIFGVRVAGNGLSDEVLGSLEYGCAVAGAKLILVMGHTRCGAVTAAVQSAATDGQAPKPSGTEHVECILRDIQQSIDLDQCRALDGAAEAKRDEFVDDVARAHVLRTAARIDRESEPLRGLVREGRIAIVAAMYDIGNGAITFL
ncbi:MAG TPA: SulP family inorganic anion transporter [Pirellulales bacterium]|jgi:carbonic anhydrase/SulP family sulfate permease|nr:SulP family inorganic anion transporter [Pirellulales bacterium]